MSKFNAADFPGLIKEMKGYDFMDRLSYIPDPEHPGVYLFKGEFDNGMYGLFIWDNNHAAFIEEPATLEDYNFRSIAQVYAKYPGLRPHN